jgi:DNA-binding CsgD family transcriptional regulator
VEALRSRPESALLRFGLYAATELWDDEAIHAISRIRLDLARNVRSGLPSATALTAHGITWELLTGRIDAAERCFEEARDLGRANPAGSGGNDARLGDLLVAAWRGDEATARALAESCIRDSTAHGTGVSIVYALYALALLELGLSRYGGALAAAREAADGWPLSTFVLPEVVEAAVRAGEPAVAAEAAARLADAAVPAGSDRALGTLARSRALLADGDEAEDLYLLAIDHLRRTRTRPQLARARLVYGEWLRRERRRRDAREQLSAAHRMFSSMGAAAFAERARLELVATGEHTRSRPEALELLTPQELRIARRAADGASNRQIGTELFLSPRTVEYHLHKAFRKLGVSSRTQLARQLVDE